MRLGYAGRRPEGKNPPKPEGASAGTGRYHFSSIVGRNGIGGMVPRIGGTDVPLVGSAGVGTDTALTGGAGIDGTGRSIFTAGTGTVSGSRIGGRTFRGSPVGTGSGTTFVSGAGSGGLGIGNRPESVGTGSGTSFSTPDKSGLNGGMIGSSGFGSGGMVRPDSVGAYGAAEFVCGTVRLGSVAARVGPEFVVGSSAPFVVLAGAANVFHCVAVGAARFGRASGVGGGVFVSDWEAAESALGRLTLIAGGSFMGVEDTGSVLCLLTVAAGAAVESVLGLTALATGGAFTGGAEATESPLRLPTIAA